MCVCIASPAATLPDHGGRVSLWRQNMTVCVQACCWMFMFARSCGVYVCEIVRCVRLFCFYLLNALILFLSSIWGSEVGVHTTTTYRPIGRFLDNVLNFPSDDGTVWWGERQCVCVCVRVCACVCVWWCQRIWDEPLRTRCDFGMRMFTWVTVWVCIWVCACVGIVLGGVWVCAH